MFIKTRSVDHLSDYESAFYALAIGFSTTPSIKRPLDWSQSTPETTTYETLIKLWMNKETPHQHPSVQTVESVFQPAMFGALISYWNDFQDCKRHFVYQEENGKLKLLNSGSIPLWSNNLFVRQVNNRWEAFGHFAQERSLAVTSDRHAASSTSSAEDRFKTWNSFFTSSGNDSGQVSKPTSSDGVPSNTFSPIVQVDIKPVVSTHTLPYSYASRDRIIELWKNKSPEQLTHCLRQTSQDISRRTEELCFWAESLNIPRNKELVLPIGGRFCQELREANFTVQNLLKTIREAGTSQESQYVRDKFRNFIKHDKEQRAKREEDKAAEKKEEEEDVEERKRKEAETAAAAYAAQDRDDSCSDSD